MPTAETHFMQKHLAAVRIAALILLVLAILAALALLLFTERGQFIRDNPHEAGRQFRDWVRGHRAWAPAIFVALYVALVLVMLPVWWLQIFAGYGFGLYVGVFWAQLGATVGALGAWLISRFILADWFHNRVEARLVKLRNLDQQLGHNGFLVVMAVRLMHFMPFGLSNYIFGLTTITAADVVVGTALGGIPAVAIGVGVGAGYRPWQNWRFLTIVAALNVLLIVPLALRYLKPQWFRKYGIE